jgi:AraC family transcriptional regulator
MQCAVRQTSRDRFWTGFDAQILDWSGGVVERPGFKDHHVFMVVGAPTRATCRCDSFVSRHLQVPGDIDIVPLGLSGAWEDEGPTAMLAVHLSTWLIRMAAEEMGANSDRVSIAPHLHLRDPQIEHIGWAIKAELEADEPSGRLYADSLGLALAAHLLRRYAPTVPRRIGSGLPQRRLQRVMDYVHDHLALDLTLAELAVIASVSPSRFKLLFKQSVGVPVHQYVIRSRAEYAINLLLNSELPLSEVALRAGFANQSHMARCMRRFTGMTPGALREAV